MWKCIEREIRRSTLVLAWEAMKGSTKFQRMWGNSPLYFFYVLQFCSSQPLDYPVAMVAVVTAVVTAKLGSPNSQKSKGEKFFSIQWNCSSQIKSHGFPFLSSLSFSPSHISSCHLATDMVQEMESLWLGDQKEGTSDMGNTREIVKREHLGKLTT